MKIQLPRTYSQNDPQWKNTTLGTRGTIGDYGCLMTSAAMMCTYFGHNETPTTLNEKLKKNGGYVNGNIFVWGAVSSIYSDIRYEGQVQTPDPLTKGQMDSIKINIDKGYPVFFQIDTVPATSAFDEHWVLAIDYDGDDFIVQDPWDGATKRITSWGVKPQELIYAYSYYSGTPTRVTSPQTPQGDDNGISVDEETFQRLVTKSTQWDAVSLFLQVDNGDASGGQKAVSLIQQVRNDLSLCQQDANNSSILLSRLQSSYNALQGQYNALQAQYATLQQDYLNNASQPIDPTSSQAFITLQKSYVEAENTIKNLQVKIIELQKVQNSLPPSDNSSTKPFWESKKVIVTSLSGLVSAGLILMQTLQIKPGDDWQEIAVKLLSAAAASLGISAVGNQYVKSQGEIDKAAIKERMITP